MYTSWTIGYVWSMHDVEEFLQVIGQRVREARLEASLTQNGLATKISASRGSITNLEAGRHVTLQLLFRVGRQLDVDVRDLIPTTHAPEAMPNRPASVEAVIRKWKL